MLYVTEDSIFIWKDRWIKVSSSKDLTWGTF